MKIFDNNNRISLSIPSVLCLILFILLLPTAQWALGGSEKDNSDDSIFGMTKVWNIHLTISPENWQKMQPTRSGGPGGRPPFFGGPPPANNGDQPANRPERRMGPPGGFFPQDDLPYISAIVEVDGKKFENVGIRYKGNATLRMGGNSLKKPIKIDFNRYVKNQEFMGQTKINLNNNFFDPSHMVEVLSYETFRDFDLPAPRTAFAKVYITVEGQYGKEYLGLYTIAEQVNENFLQRNYGIKEGLLLKPRMIRGLPYFGDNWDDYEQPYDCKTDDVTWKEAKHFMEFAKFVNEATGVDFQKKIGEYIDVEAFLRFLAVNVAIANYDSILGMGQNYYIYHETKTDKYYWIPWDMDLSFGKFMMSGSPDIQARASIREPNPAPHPLIDRLLAIPEWKEKYLAFIREFTHKILQPERIQKKVETIRAAIQDAVKEDTKVPFDEFVKCVSYNAVSKSEDNISENPSPSSERDRGLRRGPMFKLFSISGWIAKRNESIQLQLDGKSEGEKLSGPGRPGGPGGPGGFGPGGPGGPGPGGFGPGGPGGFGPPEGFGPGMFLGPQLSAAIGQDQDKKIKKSIFIEKWNQWAAGWDKDKNDSLNDKELAEGLSPIFKLPDGFPPMGPPGEFSPTFFLIPAFMEKADDEGKISKTIFQQLGNEWFANWDADKSGDLDEKEIANGLNGMIRPPQDFMDGPPGF
ncbi:MAG: CotH kinase family protein [Candidatus Omnitrophota bacterium]